MSLTIFNEINDDDDTRSSIQLKVIERNEARSRPVSFSVVQCLDQSISFELFLSFFVVVVKVISRKG